MAKIGEYPKRRLRRIPYRRNMKNKFGVPCSKIKDRIKDVDIHCTNESEAMALACGAILAGKKPTVYMQNSGFSHCIDIITSLYKPYGIELPKLILSNRCHPEHHKYIHNITKKLLEMLEYENVEVIEQE